MTKILSHGSGRGTPGRPVLLGIKKNIITAFAICLVAPPALLAHSLDLPGAYFKPGHPIEGEALRDALDVGRAAESLDNLRVTADRLAEYTGVYFEVAGHADSSECSGSECGYLSSRRAQLVFRHLLGLGVDPMRLDTLRGWGAERPIGEPNSERAWLNRRVDINVSN